MFVFQIVVILIVHLGYHKAKMEWQVWIHLGSPQFAMVFVVTIILVLHLIIHLKTMKSMSLYDPLYSGWDFPEYPFLFKKPNEAACWAISRFKRDGLGNVWGQGKYPQFLSFVGQVMMKRCEIQVALELMTNKSKIENRFFSQVIFHLPKKNSIILRSDYVQLSEKTFFQCTGGFHTNKPDYQQSTNSIYQDQDRFSCQRMTMNTINKKFDVTLHQKLAQSGGFIQFEAWFNFMKDSPPKNYGKIICCVNYSLHGMSIGLIIHIQIYYYR
jgi:hypothetical protein